MLLVDWPSTPSAVSAALVRILEGILRVPRVSFVPGPLMALLSSGRTSGLVLDASGGEDTRLSAVAWGRSVALTPALAQDQQAFVAQPLPLCTLRGGQRLKTRLRALLLRFARIVHHSTGGAGGKTIAKVPESLLTESVLDQLVSRVCLVAQLDADRPPSFTDNEPEVVPLEDETEEDYACRVLAHRYGPHASYPPSNRRAATAAVIPLASLQGWDDWVRARQSTPAPAPPPAAFHSSAGRTLPPTIAASLDGPVPPRMAGMGNFADISGGSGAGIPLRQARPEPGLPALPSAPGVPSGATGLRSLFTPSGHGSGAHWSASSQLLIPGWVRERAAEVLFEPPHGGLEDPEDPPIQWLVLDALRLLPIDLRAPLAQQILVVGGLAMLPNFTHRLAQEISWTLLHLPVTRPLSVASKTKTSRRLRRGMQAPPTGENEGGSSVAVTADSTARRPAHTSHRQPTPAPSRIEILYSPLKPLVNQVGVLNDWGPGQPFAPVHLGSSSSLVSGSTQEANQGKESPLDPSSSSPSLPATIPISTTTTKTTATATATATTASTATTATTNQAMTYSEGQIPVPPMPPSSAGSAPAFPANVLAWLGASLSGALQLHSRRSLSREEWDASVAAAREVASRLAQSTVEAPLLSEGAKVPGVGA